MGSNAEKERIEADAKRRANWKRWGPYLSERQWGTVREDYSADGDCWDYFPHDHARSRAYRWGEDGLLGITDRECRLCFALALWNGHDPILKERLFGLTGAEGNHGEDVKEHYFYLDSTPTHSYMKALYKYPQAEFPYDWLIDENRRRGKTEPEFELADTGIFDEDRYFDVFAEYAKDAPDDILIRITVTNRGPEAATLHVLPTLWFRNTWSWGARTKACAQAAACAAGGDGHVRGHATLGTFRSVRPVRRQIAALLFTENETNTQRFFGRRDCTPLCQGCVSRLRRPRRSGRGESGGLWHQGGAASICLTIPAKAQRHPALRLFAGTARPAEPFGKSFDQVFEQRHSGGRRILSRRYSPARLDRGAERSVIRQGYAGLLWSKQFYHYVVEDWLDGDPTSRRRRRKPQARPQPRLAASLQPRCHLHARQMGVSLVRRLGPGVSPDSLRADRPEVCQGPTDPVPARVVYAPERADSRLRICVRRRESARPCVGGVARL